MSLDLKVEDVKAVAEELNVGRSVAWELLMLAGGDKDLAVSEAKNNYGLNQTKASIIDERLYRIERKVNGEEEQELTQE